MADHKVYNLQDPDFWNPEKRQEQKADDLPEEDDSWNEKDEEADLAASFLDDDDDSLLQTSRQGAGGRSGHNANQTLPSAGGRADRSGHNAGEEHRYGETRQIGRRQVLEILLVAAALAAVVMLIVFQSRTRTFQSATYRTMADLGSQTDTAYMPLGSNIAVYSRDGISCMNTNGSQIWNVTYEMQQPLVARSGNVLAVGDYNGNVIHVVNDTAVLGSVNTDMPIRALSVSQSQEVAAVLSSSDATWIYLYASDGSTIAYFKTTMGKSGYPLHVAISPDGKVVAVSHLTLGTTTSNTSIAFYNFGAVGQTVTENNVAGYNYDDEIFPYIVYMNNNTCAAVSDKRVVFFNNNTGTPTAGTNAMFNARVQGVFSNEGYLCILFPDTTGQEQYSIYVYNAQGSQISTIPFTMDYTDAQICGDRIVINNDQSMIIYNVDGTLKYEGSFQDSVRAVIPQESSTSRLFIITADNKLKEMVLE